MTATCDRNAASLYATYPWSFTGTTYRPIIFDYLERSGGHLPGAASSPAVQDPVPGPTGWSEFLDDGWYALRYFDARCRGDWRSSP
jgi:hypothetical protein